MRMVLGILIIVVGVSGFAFFLVASLSRIFRGLERVEVPGRRELALEPGDYAIYWETDSRFGSAPSRSDLHLAVVPKGGGGGLSVSPSGLLSGRYSTMDRFGVSVASFRVEQKDLHAVTVAAVPGKTLPKGCITVGSRIGFLGVLKIVLVSLAILGAGIGGGVALLIRKSSS